MAKHPPLAESDLPNWPVGDPAEPLTEATVRVWLWSLDTTTSSTSNSAALSQEELQRAGQYYFEQDRRHFIAARAGMRRVLGAMLACPAHEIAFDYHGMGKPCLPGGPQGLSFNLSHSAGVGLLAVAHGNELGVDVEAVRPVQLASGIAERYFAEQEVEQLRSLPAAEQDAGFFRIWTNKEAVVKLLRSGLGYPLHSFNTPLQAKVGCAIPLTEANQLGLSSCHLHTLEVGGKLMAALAASHQLKAVQCFRLP